MDEDSPTAHANLVTKLLLLLRIYIALAILSAFSALHL